MAGRRRCRSGRGAECCCGKTQSPLVDRGVKDQILCFVCLLPAAFLLAGACVLRWASGQCTPAGGGHVDVKGVGERPG